MWANGETDDTPQKGNGALGETLICPVCGKTVFEYWGDYDICEVCGWYNDGIQYNDHNYEGGCNKKSVNQLRKEWLEKQNILKNV